MDPAYWKSEEAKPGVYRAFSAAPCTSGKQAEERALRYALAMRKEYPKPFELIFKTIRYEIVENRTIEYLDHWLVILEYWREGSSLENPGEEKFHVWKDGGPIQRQILRPPKYRLWPKFQFPTVASRVLRILATILVAIFATILFTIGAIIWSSWRDSPEGPIPPGYTASELLTSETSVVLESARDDYTIRVGTGDVGDVPIRLIHGPVAPQDVPPFDFGFASQTIIEIFAVTEQWDPIDDYCFRSPIDLNARLFSHVVVLASGHEENVVLKQIHGSAESWEDVPDTKISFSSSTGEAPINCLSFYAVVVNVGKSAFSLPTPVSALAIPTPTASPIPTPTAVRILTPTPAPTTTPRPMSVTPDPTQTHTPSPPPMRPCNRIEIQESNIVEDRKAKPHVFLGKAIIDGSPVSIGSRVTAWVDGSWAGSAVVNQEGYVVLVDQLKNRSFDGKTVYFKIGEGQIVADQTGEWSAGGGDLLNLSGRSECEQLP